MRRIYISIVIAAVAFATLSCQKENGQEPDSPQWQGLQFTATIETGTGTKTTVERYETASGSGVYRNKVKWEASDLININGTQYQLRPNTSSGNSAIFAKTNSAAEDPAGPFNAYYPAAIFNGTTATLPASYTYANDAAYPAGSFDMPMYAYSTTTTLSFKNLCGVLAVTVSGDDFATVSSIEVTSADQRMNGAFTVSNEGVLSFSSSAALTDADRKVTLTFTSPKTISTSATFNIPVPAGTHGSLMIAVTDGTDDKTMTTTKTDGVTVASNMIYPILFADNSGPEYVEMAGLKWATKNLGAETIAGELATCAGDYYQWGSVDLIYESIEWTGTTPTVTYKTGKTLGFTTTTASYNPPSTLKAYDVLPNENDAVRAKYGNRWRMPTRSDFIKLVIACYPPYETSRINADGILPDLKESQVMPTDNINRGIYYCNDYDGVAGVLFVETDGGDHLFFPAAGRFYTKNYESGIVVWQSTSRGKMGSYQTGNTLNASSVSLDPTQSYSYYQGIPIRPVADIDGAGFEYLDNGGNF